MDEYFKLLRRLITQGYDVQTRGLSTKELINENIYIHGSNFYSVDDVRYFEVVQRYLMGELTWYFSGDRKVDGIVKYSKFWDKIKNEDGTVNSNYGYSLFYKKNKYCHSPFEWALIQLLLDESSRKAIMLYNDEDYFFTGNKDFVCLASDTIIHSPEGNVTIKELTNIIKLKGKYPVFSVNFNTKKIELKWCRKAWKNGKEKIIRIHLDDKTHIDCTHNHTFYIKKKVYYCKHKYHIKYFAVEAQDLQKNDRLIPIRYPGKNLFIEDIGSNWGGNSQKRICKVEDLNIERDVYDIEVDDNHNFFINSGVLVHNCTQLQQFFIRDNKLITVIYIRSSDVVKGLTYDIPFWSIVQQQMLLELKQKYKNLELGTMSINFGSVHIYDSDIELVNKMVDGYIRKFYVKLKKIIPLGKDQAWYEENIGDHVEFITHDK